MWIAISLMIVYGRKISSERGKYGENSSVLSIARYVVGLTAVRGDT